jgi:hypothetical protein
VNSCVNWLVGRGGNRLFLNVCCSSGDISARQQRRHLSENLTTHITTDQGVALPLWTIATKQQQPVAGMMAPVSAVLLEFTHPCFVAAWAKSVSFPFGFTKRKGEKGKKSLYASSHTHTNVYFNLHSITSLFCSVLLFSPLFSFRLWGRTRSHSLYVKVRVGHHRPL